MGLNQLRSDFGLEIPGRTMNISSNLSGFTEQRSGEMNSLLQACNSPVNRQVGAYPSSIVVGQQYCNFLDHSLKGQKYSRRASIAQNKSGLGFSSSPLDTPSS
jgi:hypothetical protein